MRISFIFILIFLLGASLFAGENTEFRAVWVITWEHISASSSVEQNKARVRQILDNVKKANMNAVLWQVRQSGTAYYNSSYEPWGYYAGYQNPGYDPLAYAIEEAHKRGLELHAWFNVFSASDMVKDAPAQVHPEWVCRDGYGNPMPGSRALSPGLQAVRDYTLKVAMEVVRNYDIDGLHLDYIRWNEYSRSDFSSGMLQKPADKFPLDGMISPEKMEALSTMASTERYLYDVNHQYSGGVPSGYSTWEDYWRDSVTKFVQALHDSIQAVKPWVRLSPAALGKYNWSGWQGYNVVYQDAALWFNQGYIDQLTPMHYHWTTGNQFYGMLVSDPNNENWGHWIQPGINAGRLFSVGPGSYILSDNNVWDNHQQIVERSRDVPWVDGFQFFSYGSWKNHDYWEEASNLFFTGLTKVRPAKFLLDETPASPLLTVSKVNDQKYEIQVDPNEMLAADQRFAVYRSEDDVTDVSSDKIIDIHFGHDAYSITDTISGLQDFNGKYTYYATRLDRYWNESAPSNSFLTDSIPSFAPVVLSSNPASGETVQVNSSITLMFSKTMDSTAFQQKIEINPVVQLNQAVWSSDRKQVTITPVVNLENDTEYTLTIKKEVADINGTQLDGNADGGTSEDFILTFRTSEKDIFPPQVTFSNPSTKIYTDNFDVQDIISFAFDEILDHASLQSTSTLVTLDGEAVPHKAMIYDQDGHSILGIQPEDAFYSGHTYQVSLYHNLTDTTGNELDSTITVAFDTRPYSYTETKVIDPMAGSGYWRAPGFSGSTVGIDVVASTFDYSTAFYLPAAYSPLEKKSAKLHYVWDAGALDPGSDYLLREYLDDSAPRNVTFDTTYTLQCYVFGDGSLNKFRFAMDEGNGVTWPNHEVSKWFTIDWQGWKLVEWKLSDPDMVGSWIGNGVLDMSTYRIDSFQLTHDENGAQSGTLYFSNLRLVKKAYGIADGIAGDIAAAPKRFALGQNYPNPFNPSTTIPFAVSRSGLVKITLYNMLGQEVAVLVNKNMQPGQYDVQFNAQNLASGVYIYEMRTSETTLRKRMMLLK